MKKLLLLITLFTLNTHHTISQWVQQPLPVYKPITCIKFVNSQTGWACTDYGSQQDTGYIIATTNSGTNWFVQLAVFGNTFTDLNAIDSITCFASAFDININRDKLYKTTNGGANWTTLTMVPNMGIDDMQFLNKDSAWECGASVGPDVRTTTDGGNTWVVRTTGINAATDKVFFLNYNTGFCAAQNKLFRTTNTGLNWSLVTQFSESIYGIFFINDITGWLTQSGHKIASTTNGGINWVIQNPFGRSENIYDIVMYGNIGWAASGWTGKILKTTDTGANWGYQNIPIGSRRLSFTDTLNGWSSEVFALSHTTNGGGPITYVGIINNNQQIPYNYVLYQNYPNPFNSQTTILFDIPKNYSRGNSYIKLIIYDILGKELEIIVNQQLKPGSYKVNWNANTYTSGIYFYRLIADGIITESKKMILIK